MITTTQTAAEFRIYVACLAAYNSGRLHGEWIDVEGKDAAAVFIEINDMLARSPAPNVMRRKCADCGTWHTDARPYRENCDECDECGAALLAEFVPSAEEWAVHDHEGFAGLISGEWPDIGELCEMAEFLANAQDDARRGLLWLVNDLGCSVCDALAKADDVCTSDATPAEYAEAFADECYPDPLEALPSFMRYHIDWEGVARDLLLGGDICQTTQDGETFLITNASDF